MRNDILSGGLFTAIAYFLFLIATASIFLAIILFVKEAINSFYTHEMAPGDYLISGLVYLVAGLLLLGLVYLLRPSILKRGVKEERPEGEEKKEEEPLEELL